MEIKYNEVDIDDIEEYIGMEVAFQLIDGKTYTCVLAGIDWSEDGAIVKQPESNFSVCIPFDNIVKFYIKQ